MDLLAGGLHGLAAGVGNDPDGYRGGVFDGRFIYFAPEKNGSTSHGEVLRYDTTGLFSAASSWSTYDADKALHYCQRSVELEPGNAELQGLMAFTYIFIGNFEQARVHEQIMRKLCPILPNWYYLNGGQIEQFDGNIDKAIAIYQQGVAVEPDSTLCRLYLVHALMQKGDRETARQLADEIKLIDPGANGSGLVRSLSNDPSMRQAFRESLEAFDLYQD